MNKSELIIKLQAQLKNMSPNITDKIIQEAIELFFDTIKSGILNGHRIELRGFGSFCLHEHSAKLAYDPNTGRKFYVSAKQVPYFRASKILKDKINEDFK